jgi:ubiquinone/menaquinone biosynthesis C-methylase UbiE
MEDTEGFGTREYWDDRYSKLADDAEEFDWHQSFDNLKKILANNGVTPGKKVLILGCGNCKLMLDMFQNGYKTMDCVDWSDTVIQKMKSKHAALKGMNFTTMDVTSLDFGDSSYDVVIDKAVMDSILCGEGSTDKVIAMMMEVQRVLKPGGVFMSVTHGEKDTREFYFKHPKLSAWDIQLEQAAKDSVSLKDTEPKFFHSVFMCVN